MMQIYIDKINNKVLTAPTSFTQTIDIPENLTKEIKVYNGMIQKVNDLKQRLYKPKDEPFQETIQETIEAITVIKYEEKEIVNSYYDSDGIEHNDKVITQVPVEWVDNEPIMIPNMISKTISFLDSPSSFTVDDLITAKYREVLEKSSYEFIIASEFIEQNINIKEVDHAANTGIGFIQLLPKGQAKTNLIELDAEASTLELLLYEGDPQVELYVNDVKVQNNKVSLSSKTNNIIVTFKNPTDKALLINAYALGY